jgi:hypothetical protein
MADRSLLSSILVDAHHDLGPDNEPRLAQLRRALQLSHRFTLMLVTVDGRRERAEVLRRLSAWAGHDGVPELEIAPLTAAELEADHAHGLVLVEPEAATRAELDALIGLLNWRRDALPARVHGPLVLVLGQLGHDLLFTRAPDLHSWRGHTVSIDPAPPALAVPLGLTRSDDERRRLEATLASLRDRGLLPASEEAHLELRLGELLLDDARALPGARSQLLDQAAARFAVAHEASRRAVDDRLELRARLGDAGVAVRRGDLARGEAALAEIRARRAAPANAWPRQLAAGVDARIAELSAAIARARSEPEAELEALARAEEGYRAAGAPTHRARMLAAQADARAHRGDVLGARRDRAAADALFGQIEDRAGECVALTRRALEQSARGELERARVDALRAIALAAPLSAELRARASLAYARTLTDASAVEQELALARAEIGDDDTGLLAVQLAWAEADLAEVRNVPLEALARFARAARLAEASDDLSLRGFLVLRQAEVEAALGRSDDADRHFAEAEAHASEVGDRKLRGLTRLSRGVRSLAGTGASPEVAATLRGAIDDALAAGELGLRARARVALGHTLAALGERSAAIAELQLAIPELRDLAEVDDLRIAEQELAALRADPPPPGRSS